MSHAIGDSAAKRSTSMRFSGKKLVACSALAFLVLFFMILAVLLTIPVKSARITKLKSGRQITVVTDSLFSDLECGDDTARIMTRGKTIVVKPHVILVNNQPTENIDPALMNLRIDCCNGKVSVEPVKNLPLQTAKANSMPSEQIH